MRVKILRKKTPTTESYWESFLYDGTSDASIASLLDYLNYKDDIYNAQGESVPRIGWECSCLQGVCGSCAMVINGRPALACETFVRDLGEEISIEPLSKFFVIHDLIVDRSIIQENLKKTNAYIEEYKGSDTSGNRLRKGSKESRKRDREHAHQYSISKCLKCGLCLEVCPNYVKGEHFFGACFANDCYLIASRSLSRSEEIKEEYGEHFAKGCSKSLSCMEVCPVGIETIASMAKMNRMLFYQEILVWKKACCMKL